MKTCTKCKDEKDLSEFNKRSSAPDGLAHQCKACNSKNLKKHYQENKTYYRDKADKHKEKLRQYVDEYKGNKGCFMCGESRHWVLDFHHTDNNKEYNISDLMLKIQSPKKLKAEIEKCEVVCSNCHRDLHYQERQ